MTPWLQTLASQNYKTKNVCCFKPPSFWCFVAIALRNLHKGLNLCCICKGPLPGKITFTGSPGIEARTSLGPEEKAVIGILGEEEEVKGPWKWPRAEAKLQRKLIWSCLVINHIYMAVGKYKNLVAHFYPFTLHCLTFLTISMGIILIPNFIEM